MPELGPEIVGEVIAACTAGADEAAASIGRNLGLQVKVSVLKACTFNMQSPPEGFSGAGLVAVLTPATSAALVLFPESSGFVPAWCGNPDPTGQSKLTTLAQELGMVLLPEQFMPEQFKAGVVKGLHGALVRGGVADGAPVVPLQLEAAGGKKGLAYIIWPAHSPSAVWAEGTLAGKSPSKPAAVPSATPKSSLVKTEAARPRPTRLEDLPQFTRSLLRIKVPVMVTLAKKRQSLGWIVELGPGSIIQFDKSCEEMLDLDVGGRPIANGEAVKVGDKFGLRITSIIMPEERFKPVKPGAGAKR